MINLSKKTRHVLYVISMTALAAAFVGVLAMMFLGRA